MNFLIDNQLPPALAHFLEDELQTKATHVADVGLRDSSDAEVWRYASLHDLIVVSKDEDFVDILLHNPGARLVWVRIGNCRRAYLLDVFRKMLPRIVERLESGDALIEIR